MIEKVIWGALFGIAILALMLTLALAIAEVAMTAAKGMVSAMEWVREEFS